MRDWLHDAVWGDWVKQYRIYMYDSEGVLFRDASVHSATEARDTIADSTTPVHRAQIVTRTGGGDLSRIVADWFVGDGWFVSVNLLEGMSDD